MPTGSEQNNGTVTASNVTSIDNKQLVNGKIAIKPNSVKRRGSEAQEANNKATKQKKLVSSLANSSNLANIEKKTPKRQTVRMIYYEF